MTAPNIGGPLLLNERDRHVVDEIIAPARPQQKRGVIFNEGFRHGALGETGSGKTALMRVIVYSAIAKGYARFALVHDTKGIFSEYPRSVQLAHTHDFAKRNGFHPGEPAVASFRGDPRRDVEVSAEEVAQLSLALARRGSVPHICVIEEASEAATEGRKRIKAPSVLKLLEQGRKMGVSLLWTTQSPALVPLPMLNQSSSMSFGRLTGSDANYLADRMKLDSELVSTIRGSHGQGLPNFDFALMVKGKIWDGQIYRLDKRTALMFE